MTDQNTYLQAIDEGLVRTRLAEATRAHLGYSEIGKEDERNLWLGFRWCLPRERPPRTLRIFDQGNATEELLAKWTRDAGVHLVTLDPNTNQQFAFTRFGGHLSGHMDGAVFSLPEFPGQWGVWEAKSANDTRFKNLGNLKAVKEGKPLPWERLSEVGLRAWAPEYWGQVICYMGETGMRYAVVLILNKNNGELMAEFIEADDLAFQTLVSKAERIITADRPPDSIYSSPADWRAKLFMSELERRIYFTQELPPTANCRNCRFSEPDLETGGGQWRCRKYNSLIPGIQRQLDGCDQHQFIPELMPASQLVIDDAIAQYRTPEGHEFINGPSHYSSAELIELAKTEFSMLGDPFFQQSRAELGARVTRIERIKDAVMAHAERVANPPPDYKGDPWPKEVIPF